MQRGVYGGANGGYNNNNSGVRGQFTASRQGAYTNVPPPQVSMSTQQQYNSSYSNSHGSNTIVSQVTSSRFGSNRFHSNQANSTNISNNRSVTGSIPETRIRKDYFDEDDDEETTHQSNALPKPVDDDVDPLEAFMAGVQEQVTKEKIIAATAPQKALIEIVSGLDAYDDNNDYKVSSKRPSAAVSDSGRDNEDDAGEESDDEDDTELSRDKEDEYEYDIDGVLVSKGKNKVKVTPLPPIDHSTIQYAKFRKCFYSQHPEISKMSEEDIEAYKKSIEVSAQWSQSYSDVPVPRPIQSFSQSGLHGALLVAIAGKGFEKPTPIQAQSLPIALSGHDIIGLAKTGSGKTFSFVWPMIMHVLDQPRMKAGDGPIGLILCPTRELAAQIYSEAKAFCKIYNIGVCAIYGGAGKWEMQKALKETPEIVVATPGRFIEMVKLKATNLLHCTMLVLDEADRMFEMGFEYQMRSIVNNIRPDRQTLLFSATMKKKVEGFANEILTDPIRVVVGHIGQSNPDIKQIAQVLGNEFDKWTWLASCADEFVADGKVLIFVSGKAATDELSSNLQKHFDSRRLAISVASLHGDKDQNERLNILKSFCKHTGAGQETTVLVATDIAARGLDIQNIRTVINYDVPKNIETYVHRIGRTGRMNRSGIVPGTAYTLLTSSDSSFAVDLVHNLRLSGLEVTPQLQRLAETNHRYHKVNGKFKALSGSGPRGGLGAGSGTRQAMTSAMLAATSRSQAPVFESVVTSSVGKFLKGVASSNSDTTSQWVPSQNPADKADMAPNNNPVASGESGKIVEPQPKRVSRFSSFKASEESSSPPAVSSANFVGAVPLKGFIRASSAYSSVSAAGRVDNHGRSSVDIPLPFSPKEIVLQDMTPKLNDLHGQFAGSQRPPNAPIDQLELSSYVEIQLPEAPRPKKSRWDS